ncbi:methylmalonyl-CoA mutase, partial [bacterium]
KKERIVVGVNAFQVEEKMDLERLKVDPAIELGQKARLAELRKNRDQAKANELLGALDTAARGSENLMPLLVTCVENDLTLGEICGVLRKVWGEYQPPVWG